MSDILKDLQDEMDDMTREQLIGQIMYLRSKVARLEDTVSDMGWRLNPDRMSGQFTEEEINRGNEWR